MLRALVLAGLLAVAPVVVLNAGSAHAQAPNGQKCEDNAQKKAKRSMFGSILGSVGGTVLGSMGGNVGAVASLAMPAASYLGEELLKMLRAIRFAELGCIRYRGQDPEIQRQLVELGEAYVCDQLPTDLQHRAAKFGMARQRTPSRWLTWLRQLWRC